MKHKTALERCKQYILERYEQNQVQYNVTALWNEFIDEDDIDDFDGDEQTAYIERGRNGAELMVIEEMIVDAQTYIQEELNSDDRTDLFEFIAFEYDLTVY